MSISSALLAALMMVESGGDPSAIGDGGKAVGVLQIHECVVDDVNRFYGTHYVWPGDCYDQQKSITIASLYLEHWGRPQRFRGKPPTHEQLARIWNGGPNGHKAKSTKPYWRKVKKELAK